MYNYKEEVKKAKLHAQRVKEKQKINEIKHQNDKPVNLTFNKKIFLLISLNMIIVELYSMFVMVFLRDLSALYSLIGAVIGFSLNFVAYSHKATKENTVGGIIYETAMREQDKQCDNKQDEAVG